MLDRIVVNVVGMLGEISFVANQVLEIASLPDTTFALGQLTLAQEWCGRTSMRETPFDQFPARGEVGNSLGQSPHRMQVLGQHDHCVNLEG